MSYLSQLNPDTMYQVSRYLDPKDLSNLQSLEETSNSINSDRFKQMKAIDILFNHLVKIRDLYVIDRNGRLVKLNSSDMMNPCNNPNVRFNEMCHYSILESPPKIREYISKGLRFRVDTESVYQPSNMSWLISQPKGVDQVGRNMYINSKVLVDSIIQTL